MSSPPDNVSTLVDAFREVTGLPAEMEGMDDDTIQGLLASHSYNLDAAVRSFFDVPQSTPETTASSNHQSRTTRTISGDEGSSSEGADREHDNVLRSRRTRGTSPLATATHSSTNGVSPNDTTHATATAAPPPPRSSLESAALRLLRPITMLTGANDDTALPRPSATRFVQDLRHLAAQSMLTPLLIPDFLETSFDEAIAETASLNQILIVYLHSWLHPHCIDFCRDVLCTSAMVDVINGDRVRLWGGSVETRDALQAANSLSVSGFPCLVVIATNTIRPRVLDRIYYDTTTDPVPLASFVSRVQNRIDAAIASTSGGSGGNGGGRGFGTPPITAPSPADEERRRIIGEQNAELARSMEEDRRKAEQRRKKEEDDRIMAELAKQQQEEQLKAITSKRARLQPEPVPGGPQCVSLRINLPDGTRLQRRFLRHNRLIDLRDYLDVHFFDANRTINYAISTNLPKRVFQSPDEDHLTMEEAGLAPQAVLFLQDLDA